MMEKLTRALKGLYYSALINTLTIKRLQNTSQQLMTLKGLQFTVTLILQNVLDLIKSQAYLRHLAELHPSVLLMYFLI